MKAPNSKFQTPGKLQTSMSKERKVAHFSFWNLRIEISLELGPWDLELCCRRAAYCGLQLFSSIESVHSPVVKSLIR
jgi:hypothetical protein